jgi:hypothetical protein
MVVDHPVDVRRDPALVARIEPLEREVVAGASRRDERVVTEFGTRPCGGRRCSKRGYGPLLLVRAGWPFRDRADGEGGTLAFS